MLSVRVADVFDAYVMGRVACVKRPGAYPYSVRWLTSRSFAMIAVSFGRLFMPVLITVDRGKQ
jgi:hypothetical protein